MRYFQGEHMLGVVGGARRVSVAPLRKYLVVVRHAPVDYAAIGGGIDAGLLAKFARRCLGERSSSRTRKSGVYTRTSVEIGVL